MSTSVKKLLWVTGENKAKLRFGESHRFPHHSKCDTLHINNKAQSKVVFSFFAL